MSSTSSSTLSVAQPTQREIHPSIAPARIPNRREESFGSHLGSSSIASSRGSAGGAPGLTQLISSVAPAAGPIGGLIAAGAGMLGGGSSDFAQLAMMQAQNQAYNMEMLSLQESAQAENRRFTTLSNLMKAQHDTAKAAISNIRV